MEKLVLVGLGGGAGAIARYLTGVGYGRLFGAERGWPATFAVNVAGGLLMGVLVGWLAQRDGQGASAGAERWRLLLGVGGLGGFTTFSTFSLEALGMVQRREAALAAAYAVGSVVLSVAAVFVGLQLARKVFA